MSGPAPAFQPRFPKRFVDEAKHVAAQRIVALRRWQRARLVLLLHDQPQLSNVQAAQQVSLSDQTVRFWRRRWASGDFSLDDKPGRGRKPGFSPFDHASVKATACELVCQTDQPLSRQSTADITRRVNLIVPRPMSTTTVWRILARDAIRPWRYRYWIFPRDAHFGPKAAAILDLYAGIWQGQPLGERDFVISSDEKTSIQARIRCHPSLPPRPGEPLRIEPEYERGGAVQYLAAWDVHRGVVFGRCEAKTGIASFSRLVEQVMQQAPYWHAERVFWIVDNGSSHRGQRAINRLQKQYPNAIMVHTPVHASWLNQIEIYFSMIQRKVLIPNDFESLADVEARLERFAQLYNAHPKPFNWKFDRQQLRDDMSRLNQRRAERGQEPLEIAERAIERAERPMDMAA